MNKARGFIAIIATAIVLVCAIACSKNDSTQKGRELTITAITIKNLPIDILSQRPLPYLGVQIQFTPAKSAPLTILGGSRYSNTASALPVKLPIDFKAIVTPGVDGPVKIIVFTSATDPNTNGGNPVHVGVVNMNPVDRNDNPSQDFSENGTVLEIESNFK